MASHHTNGEVFTTRILPVKTGDLGRFKDPKTLEHWELSTDPASLKPLQEAAQHLKSSDIPVGFSTETVYGLGADATRSDAVKGIYKAKGRPSDNPLIIHICDLTMLRDLIRPSDQTNGNSASVDPIPEIYKPLIKKFWPGPLTILLPNPIPSKLAPEVTAGLQTFGARMPSKPLALSLIHLAGVPLAAPSANASTKPSPTTAEHVQYDLNGKIEIILDGGPCQVGVESTVVDGMCDPPVVLRPGGVSIDRIRECDGWSGVVKRYKDQSEVGTHAPRAPGMKYKHYSPKAKVILYEATPGRKTEFGVPTQAVRDTIEGNNTQHNPENLHRPPKIGIVRTKRWYEWAGFHNAKCNCYGNIGYARIFGYENLKTANSFAVRQGELWHASSPEKSDIFIADIIEISLGKETKDIAHGLFSALRELDQRDVDIIYVEGIEDEGDIAAAVMNRLRKAASVIE
jgi:L-threonylcarbamoyladenylate synthase